MPSSKPAVLILNPVSEAHRNQIAEHFEVHFAPTPEQLEQTIAAVGDRIEIAMSIGSIGITAAQIDALPNLKLVHALGVGYEKIDVTHAKQRGIATSNGAGTNDTCVADHTMALILAVIRNVPQLDQLTRKGFWRTDIPWPLHVSGKKLGILGLGAIGEKIAKRAQAFDLSIGYHNRKPRADAVHTYFPTLDALAEWADILVVATPGGAATQHLINADILKQLGSNGYLINIARGSVVDTAALEQALRHDIIKGAALDVYEDEPHVPPSLFDLTNLVLTPHVAGWSPEAIQLTIDKFLENARRLYAGEPLLTPI